MPTYLDATKLAELNEADVEVSPGTHVRIRALDPSEFMELLPDDVDATDEKSLDASVKKALAKKDQGELFNNLVTRGCVNPKVTLDGSNGSIPVSKLGSLKLPLVNAIMEFSGMGESMKKFRITSLGARGGADGGEVRSPA